MPKRYQNFPTPPTPQQPSTIVLQLCIATSCIGCLLTHPLRRDCRFYRCRNGALFIFPKFTSQSTFLEKNYNKIRLGHRGSHQKTKSSLCRQLRLLCGVLLSCHIQGTHVIVSRFGPHTVLSRSLQIPQPIGLRHWLLYQCSVTASTLSGENRRQALKSPPDARLRTRPQQSPMFSPGGSVVGMWCLKFSNEVVKLRCSLCRKYDMWVVSAVLVSHQASLDKSDIPETQPNRTIHH